MPPSAWSQQNTSIMRKKNLLSPTSTSSPTLQQQQQQQKQNSKTNPDSCKYNSNNVVNRNNYDNVANRVPTSGVVDAMSVPSASKLYEDDERIEIHVNKDSRFDDFGFSIMDSVYGR